MKKILSEIASGVQKTFDMFTDVLRKVKEGASKYVPSFKTPKASPYTGDKLTEIEKISYQCKTTYRGDIRHLFLFYPFDERLDAWERENHHQNDRLAIDEFYGVYGSVNDPSFLERIADRRSECERSFGRCKCGYRRDEISNRDAIEAELYMFITGITTYLTAITAYPVGRTDLMRLPTAFRRICLVK